MAIVTYVPPFAHFYGSFARHRNTPPIVGSHHVETGDVVRKHGRKYSLAAERFKNWYQHRNDKSPRSNRHISDASEKFSTLTQDELRQWQDLLDRLTRTAYHDDFEYMTPQNLYVLVSIFRALAEQPPPTVPPSFDKIPGSEWHLIDLRSNGNLFGGSATAPEAPDGSLLFLRVTNSRHGQARLFTSNDLHIPTSRTCLSFTTITNHAVNWTITPDTVAIKPNETIGIETRLLSADYLPLPPNFSRLETVHPWE
jgi:hypothetical protein